MLLATRSNFIGVMKSLTSQDAVFGYAGHAAEGAAGADLESSLTLTDGALDADTLFSRVDEAPAIPFPRRVLLAACGSAGSTGTGRGEWLGVAAGALISGAQQVIATAWPIRDTAFTQEFDAAALALLQESADVAASLRELQLACLDRWRASASAGSSKSRPAQPSQAPPLIWAAYQFLGAMNP